jgi:hypothetical protein
MIPKHLEARVESARKALSERLRDSGSRYPGDVTEAIDRLVVARLNVLAAMSGQPTSDERDEAAAERLEPRAVLLRFQADIAQAIRAMTGMRKDLAVEMEALARMVEGYPVDEYVSGER